MPLFGNANPPNVDELEAKRDVPGLIKALGYEKDSGVRSAAAIALRQTGDPRVVQPLMAALKDVDEEVRLAAAQALGEIGAAAVEPLIVALNDADEDVRKIAATALCKIGDTRAVDPLISALKDVSEGVRMIAVEALGQIGGAAAIEPS